MAVPGAGGLKVLMSDAWGELLDQAGSGGAEGGSKSCMSLPPDLAFGAGRIELSALCCLQLWRIELGVCAPLSLHRKLYAPKPGAA